MIVISFFLVSLPFARAQTTTIQPLHVWTDKPVYYPGDYVWVLWDKTGSCVVPGATGFLHWLGGPPANVNEQLQLDEATILSGEYRAAQPVHTTSVGSNWTVTVTIGALGCTSRGTASFHFAQPVPEFSNAPLSMIIAIFISVVCFKVSKRKKKN